MVDAGVNKVMEEFITANLVQLGNIINCVCEQGCFKAGQCQNYCKKNACDTTPEGTWEKVLVIHRQPALQDDWVYFTLTNNKEFGAWGNSLVIRFIAAVPE